MSTVPCGQKVVHEKNILHIWQTTTMQLHCSVTVKHCST